MTSSSGRRRRLLFLSHCLPYPPHSGPRSRTLNVLGELQRDFDVQLLPFSRHNHQPLPGDLDSARRTLEHVVTHVGLPVPIPGEQSLVRHVWDHFRSVISRRPYTYYEYHSNHFRSQLRMALRCSPPDLVHLDSLDLYGYLGHLPRVPVACTHHDIDPLLLRLRASRSGILLGHYLAYQADLVEQLMRVFCPRFDLNLVTSELDAERLKTIAPASLTLVAPNGVDTQYFRPIPEIAPVPGRIVFIGSTQHFANRDAVEYFLSDVFPRIRARLATASLALVGAHPESDRAHHTNRPDVFCLGHVLDVRPHIAEASCSVAPIRVGGGTRIKILDSWAMGKAVVATSIGCEGLQAADDDNILIRDTPDGLADAIVAVLVDSALRRRLESKARQTVESHYSWDRIGQQLRNAYWRLICRAGDRRSDAVEAPTNLTPSDRSRVDSSNAAS